MRSEGKMGNQQLVSPSRQCSNTSVGFGQGFLGKEQSDPLEHPPYSPDLAAADVYLFPRLKPALKGGAFVVLLISLTMRRKS